MQKASSTCASLAFIRACILLLLPFFSLLSWIYLHTITLPLKIVDQTCSPCTCNCTSSSSSSSSGSSLLRPLISKRAFIYRTKQCIIACLLISAIKVLFFRAQPKTIPFLLFAENAGIRPTGQLGSNLFSWFNCCFHADEEGSEVDPVLREEIGKHPIDLLSEELKLQVMVVKEGRRKSKSALDEAERLSSQYRREASKCNVCVETCETARERAVRDLAKQRKLSEMWKQKAVALGWGRNSWQDRHLIAAQNNFSNI